MPYIYIVLTFTGTIFSKLIKVYSKKEYSHVSLSLNESFDEMYSFSRKYTYNPFIGIFQKEDFRKGLYGINPNAKLLIYKKNFSDKVYNDLSSDLEVMYNNRNNYYYNISGVFKRVFNIKEKLKNKFTCSQFVASKLNKFCITNFEYPSLVLPSDFMNLQYFEYYNGTIGDFLLKNRCL